MNIFLLCGQRIFWRKTKRFLLCEEKIIRVRRVSWLNLGEDIWQSWSSLPRSSQAFPAKTLSFYFGLYCCHSYKWKTFFLSNTCPIVSLHNHKSFLQSRSLAVSGLWGILRETFPECFQQHRRGHLQSSSSSIQSNITTTTTIIAILISIIIIDQMSSKVQRLPSGNIIIMIESIELMMRTGSIHCVSKSNTDETVQTSKRKQD